MDRKILIIAVAAIACVAVGAAAYVLMNNDDKQEYDGPVDPVDVSKSAVLYFSYTGHTDEVAKKLAEMTGSTLLRIEAAVPYTEQDTEWEEGNRAHIEQNDPASRPEIVSIPDISSYDVIFLGYPIWDYIEPRIMDTLVESVDFTGKTVVPFCTSESSPVGDSDDNLKANAGTGEW
ncbi:MAG: hypothetical protein E7Z63_05500, partial [Thermoplasmata archaeon]|nr:hypothetical protein [Thermoplasmata archaeon]